MKKLFIIGASILQLPAIKKAKEMGMCVAVADYNSSAIGVPFADKYYNVSTIDEEGIYEAAKDFGADGIMTLATDMPIRALAYTCEKLGLVGISYDTAIKSTDKGEMIRTFERYNVPHPFFAVAKNGVIDDSKSLQFPLITKPTDNSGSRGVMLVHNKEELRIALSYSSKNGRNGDVIIEEYMQGPEVSVEIMVVDGQPYILQITDKLTTGAPHFVEMGHSQPSSLSKDVQKRIVDVATRAVLAVGIKNSPAHVEIIVTKDGPKLVELGARMGGDCITTHLVPFSTGIDMVKATINMALGENPDVEEKHNKASAIRYFKASCGMITAINGVEEAKNIVGIKEISFVKNIGDMVGNINASGDRIGFVISQADTTEEAIALCEKALEIIDLNITPTESVN